jgi:hypothetical protein
MQMMTFINNEDIPVIISVLVAAIALVIAVILIVRNSSRTADGRKIKMAVKKFSNAYRQDVIFSDGMGGYFFIDYLILLPGRILALKLCKIEGYVFGGDNIELWTQVENNQSAKFKNPIEDVKLFVKHAADQLKFDGIMARVLFNSKSEFPKGVPEGVLQMANFKENMPAWSGETHVADATNMAWDKLSALLEESRERYNKETGVG